MEIAGAHALAPGFGTGLNAWGAAITVALGSLACGYALGGALADARGGRVASQLLPAALLTAGAGSAADAVIWRGVVHGLADAGPRLGALLAAAVLFAPSFLALGAVPPLAVKMWTRSLDEVGRRSGWVSSLSAGGSLAGAAAAGFLLVPVLPLEAVFAGCAAIMGLGAAIVLVAAGLRKSSGAAALAALCVLALPTGSPGPGVLEERGSLFGPLTVMEKGSVRYVIVAGGVQGAALLGRLDESYLPHVKVISGLVSAHLDDPANELVVLGLGAGHMPRSTGPARCETVEIDPAVLDAAEKWFEFDRERWPVHLADARAFLIADRRLHDAIVHDALRGGEPPFHLMSREFFELASRRLRPGGLMIVNYQGPISGPGAAVVRSLELTLREVFPHVALCVQERPGGEGSVILAGCRQEWEPDWPNCPGYVGLDTLLDGGEAVVLTDSRNPVPLWWTRYVLEGR